MTDILLIIYLSGALGFMLFIGTIDFFMRRKYDLRDDTIETIAFAAMTWPLLIMFIFVSFLLDEFRG